jgi:hypothetical protein
LWGDDLDFREAKYFCAPVQILLTDRGARVRRFDERKNVGEVTLGARYPEMPVQ